MKRLILVVLVLLVLVWTPLWSKGVTPGGSKKLFSCAQHSILGMPLPLTFWCWSMFGTPTPYNTNTGAIAYDFGHQNTDELNYIYYTGLLDGISHILFGGLPPTQVSVTGAVVQIGSPVYDWYCDPGDDGCRAIPAKARLFFLVDDDWMSDQWADKRWWWNPDGVALLGGGQFQMTVPMDPTKWSNGNGQFAVGRPTQWSYALRHITAIGFSFGGGWFFGHGVWIDAGTGSASFVISQFQAS